MMILLTIALAVLILKLNQPMVVNTDNFVEQLAKATKERYALEYAKERPVVESDEVFYQHIHLISPCSGLMNAYNYREFKTSVIKAIQNSNRLYRAELCFIHDLMLEEYHKLVPEKKQHMVGINEFYNLFKTYL